jgi:hypothetical protein
MIPFSSWPGFVPAIHVFLSQVKLRRESGSKAGLTGYEVGAAFNRELDVDQAAGVIHVGL